jgi:hypothetical protein
MSGKPPSAAFFIHGKIAAHRAYDCGRWGRDGRALAAIRRIWCVAADEFGRPEAQDDGRIGRRLSDFRPKNQNRPFPPSGRRTHVCTLPDRRAEPFL